jgi:ABC-2 type transport system ATP-binding protein
MVHTTPHDLGANSTGIAVRGLTKHFGPVRAVDDLGFEARPGTVTGFLGPNGSGKSTTLRMAVGLVRPDAGSVTIDGRAYRDLPRPAATVGAVLDPNTTHPACSGWDHLMIYARMSGYGRRRVAAVIDELELGAFVRRRTGGYSTGMRQRLNLATALLGDPTILILDEPTNGLDPQGVAWLRALLRRLAAEGRTVVISSHVLSEVQLVIDRAVMIKSGRLVGAGTMTELAGRLLPVITVGTTDLERLISAVTAADRGHDPRVELHRGPGPDQLQLRGLDAEAVARTAHEAGILLTELTTKPPSLEDLFLDLTTDPAIGEAGNRPTADVETGVPA